MKVFLDATLLYSASRPGSLMAQFVARVMQMAKAATNAYAQGEAERNLERNEPENLAHLRTLAKKLELIETLHERPNIQLREKDRPILSGAVAGACTHLLTSDRRDFGCYFGKVVYGVRVVSPQMLAEEIGLRKK